MKLSTTSGNKSLIIQDEAPDSLGLYLPKPKHKKEKGTVQGILSKLNPMSWLFKKVIEPELITNRVPPEDPATSFHTLKDNLTWIKCDLACLNGNFSIFVESDQDEIKRQLSNLFKRFELSLKIDLPPCRQLIQNKPDLSETIVELICACLNNFDALALLLDKHSKIFEVRDRIALILNKSDKVDKYFSGLSHDQRERIRKLLRKISEKPSQEKSNVLEAPAFVDESDENVSSKKVSDWQLSGEVKSVVQLVPRKSFVSDTCMSRLSYGMIASGVALLAIAFYNSLRR